MLDRPPAEEYLDRSSRITRKSQLAMAAARACSSSAVSSRFAFAEEAPPPETLDVVRRQRQLLRRVCLDPIAEESDSDSDVMNSRDKKQRGSVVHYVPHQRLVRLQDLADYGELRRV